MKNKFYIFALTVLMLFAPLFASAFTLNSNVGTDVNSDTFQADFTGDACPTDGSLYSCSLYFWDETDNTYLGYINRTSSNPRPASPATLNSGSFPAGDFGGGYPLASGYVGTIIILEYSGTDNAHCSGNHGGSIAACEAQGQFQGSQTIVFSAPPAPSGGDFGSLVDTATSSFFAVTAFQASDVGNWMWNILAIPIIGGALAGMLLLFPYTIALALILLVIFFAFKAWKIWRGH